MADLMKDLLNSGGFPTKKEKIIIRRVLQIVRAHGKMDIQQKLLMDLVHQAASTSEIDEKPAPDEKPPTPKPLHLNRSRKKSTQ